LAAPGLYGEVSAERLERDFTLKIPPGLSKGEHRILLSDADTLNHMQTMAGMSDRFIDLPRGTYQLRFELQGFDPLIRQGLELNAGFAARINVSLKVGSLQETVTVSGASPVVDLTTTRGGQNVSTDLITIALPGLKQMADVIGMTPGLHSTDGYKPGAIGLNGRSRFNTYGIDSGNTNVTIMVDGFKIIANSQPDFANTVETDVKTYGNSAEVKEAGALINMVTKSGGNDFRGRFSESYMRGPEGNLSPGLTARGLSVGTSLTYYNDVSGDLGGRIVRDKLWFFGSFRDRRNQTTRPGLVLNPGPDGVYLTGDEPPAFPKSRLNNPTIKTSYQVTPKYQLVADYAREVTQSDADYQKTIFNAQPAANPDFTHIAFEATQVFRWVPTRWKTEFKGTPTNHLLFDAQFGRSTYLLDYLEQPACGTTPPTYDRNTLMLTGCGIQQQSDFTMWVGDGSLTYVPSSFLGGSHEFKLGYQLSMRDITGNSQVRPSGNYALMFDVVNGVPHQPLQFETANAPVEPDNWDNVYSAYFADQWRLGQRLTFNLGVRYDYQHSYVPEQTRLAGPFAAAATFPRVEVGRWGHFAPRAAVVAPVAGAAHDAVLTVGRSPRAPHSARSVGKRPSKDQMCSRSVRHSRASTELVMCSHHLSLLALCIFYCAVTPQLLSTVCELKSHLVHHPASFLLFAG